MFLNPSPSHTGPLWLSRLRGVTLPLLPPHLFPLDTTSLLPSRPTSSRTQLSSPPLPLPPQRGLLSPRRPLLHLPSPHLTLHPHLYLHPLRVRRGPSLHTVIPKTGMVNSVLSILDSTPEFSGWFQINCLHLLQLLYVLNSWIVTAPLEGYRK